MIKYMHVRVAFKKRKVVHERDIWIITVYDNPSEIVKYDHKTTSNVRKLLFTPKAKDKSFIIRKILEIVELSRSQITLDEHRRIAKGKMQ